MRDDGTYRPTDRRWRSDHDRWSTPDDAVAPVVPRAPVNRPPVRPWGVRHGSDPVPWGVGAW